MSLPPSINRLNLSGGSNLPFKKSTSDFLLCCLAKSLYIFFFSSLDGDKKGGEDVVEPGCLGVWSGQYVNHCDKPVIIYQPL